MSNEKMYLSVVVPFLNEEGNLIPLIEALIPVFSTIGKPCEVILIDDGSTDNSLYVATQLTNKYSNVKCIELSRNFGQEQAILAGLTQSLGDVIISMDADLQHSPNLILKLLEKFEAGFDVINTTRKDREISWGKRMLFKLFYKIINLLSGTNIYVSSFNFRLVSRGFLNEFLQLKEKNRFDRGLIEWLGFKQDYFEYFADKRYSGKSNYSFKKLMLRSVDAVTDFSVRPLRFFFYIGIISFLFCTSLSVWIACGSSINEQSQSNYLMALIVFLLGVQFLGIGLICEYLAKVYKEKKDRPSYVIKRIID